MSTQFSTCDVIPEESSSALDAGQDSGAHIFANRFSKEANSWKIAAAEL